MLFHRQPHNRFRTSRDILAEEGLSTVGCGNLFYDVEPQNVRCIIGCFVRMKSCENFRRIAFSVICYCQAEKILCYFYLCVNRNFHKTRISIRSVLCRMLLFRRFSSRRLRRARSAESCACSAASDCTREISQFSARGVS